MRKLSAAALALVSVVLYGGLRISWQLGHMPERLSPVGPDLVVFTGWGAVALCGAAAVTLVAMMTVRTAGPARTALAAVAWAVGGAFVVSGALLLLDVVGTVIPGLGIPVHPLGAVSKAACVGCGSLVWRSARAYRRVELKGLDHTPRWAYAGAYVAVGGFLTRVAAQAAVGFGSTPSAGGTAVFEAGFLLAGTVLPLALVHRWGRVWPSWAPGLAGRAVPRGLVLWPAVAVSGGLLAYFGVGLGQMVAERLSGRVPFGAGDPPETFYWVAVPAYLVWGAGLAVATSAYARRTRVPYGSAPSRPASVS
ncbi:hypothetical protein E1292_22810 [Nonomuraea deserti]|uniref:DUF3995 domain-containing protein n=1 Tax=Nonomuraea deserti TaxID=1848322 RepID=A0A4V2YA88_9ACTN|nr:hypothetical protein [Nonomuraea deserti]TDD02776.1 hypothetical protein E1292_22810 [Nonomuraea deserti]